MVGWVLFVIAGWLLLFLGWLVGGLFLRLVGLAFVVGLVGRVFCESVLGFSWFFVESLILAQDERWRRA